MVQTEFSNFKKVIDGTLYSSIDVGKNQLPSNWTFFRHRVGDDKGYHGSHYSYADTNMEMSNYLPCPKEMVLKQIGFLFNPVDIEKIQEIFNHYYGELQICNKVCWEGLLCEKFNISTQPYFPSIDKKIDRYNQLIYHDLETPLKIDSQEYFSFKINSAYPVLHAPFKLWVIFRGPLTVAIQ